MTLDHGALGRLRSRVRTDVDSGLLPSAQVAVGLGGDVVWSETLGDAGPDTRYAVFSAVKPLVAAVVWQLLGEGSVRLDDPVAEHVDGFGDNGKERVTLEHVLLHTCGFPRAPLDPTEDRAGRREYMRRWRLAWPPGTRYEYHASSAHWVLAEVVESRDGRSLPDALDARLRRPLGLAHRLLGVEGTDGDGIAELVVTGEEATPDELEAVLGWRQAPIDEVPDDVLVAFNDSEVRALGIPGGGGIMTAADLARCYQAFCHDRSGLWDPAVRADAIGRVRNTFVDPRTRWPANRTIGLVVAGDDGGGPRRGFGPGCSPETFGHGGAGGQVAWADPRTGLSFAFVTNGIDANAARQRLRAQELSALASACVTS